MHNLLEQSRQLRAHAQELREEMRIANYESQLKREKSRLLRQQRQQDDASRSVIPNLITTSK
jgi:hypothetical protein